MKDSKRPNVPLIGVISGSISDFTVMASAVKILKDFGVPFERKVISAHRTPQLMFEYAQTAQSRGLKIIIAGAGGAAHLPGMVSALTPLPVLGVPVPSNTLSGWDSLLSIVQMPRGVPTATFAIGEAGAVNAALFAIRFLALNDKSLARKLEKDRESRAQDAIRSNEKLVDLPQPNPRVKP